MSTSKRVFTWYTRRTPRETAQTALDCLIALFFVWEALSFILEAPVVACFPVLLNCEGIEISESDALKLLNRSSSVITTACRSSIIAGWAITPQTFFDDYIVTFSEYGRQLTAVPAQLSTLEPITASSKATVLVSSADIRTTMQL